MSSINTNASAMSALSTLRQINSSLESTQSRISTGLKVESGKDNAAYFQISETMKGDSSVYASINEGLTLTKNSVATARLGAETINDLGQQFLDKVAFAQGATGGQAEIENDQIRAQFVAEKFAVDAVIGQLQGIAGVAQHRLQRGGEFLIVFY